MTKYQPGVRVSEYILDECIGAGTFGEVWRAHHHMWKDDEAAVKLPTEPEYVRYLRHEGAMVHGLRHPNIIRVIGMDPYAETPYLVMELVKGPSLRTVVQDYPKGLPITATLVIVRGILRALAAAHASNVLHRDIKPGNVMLHLDGGKLDDLCIEQVKVGDFGLGMGDVNALRSVAQSDSLNRDDAIVGTLAYMAPELRDGQRKPDPRTDLYSVGVLLFELLTGERPAGTELPSAIRRETPAALDEVFRRLYARHDGRYESAEAVLEDLEARLRRAEGAPAGRGERPASTASRRSGQQTHCLMCHTAVSDEDNYCIHCGVKIREPRRCGQCSGYPAPEDRYCVVCGYPLSPVEE